MSYIQQQRVLNEIQWGIANTDGGVERLRRRVLLSLRKNLQHLAYYSEEAAKALVNPPVDWIDWVSNTNFDKSKPLSVTACCACNELFCSAWVALKCSGCGKTVWYDQTTIGRLWCRSCQAKYILESPITALRAETGLLGLAGLRLFESAEQLAIAYIRWYISRLIQSLAITKNSCIVAARCRKNVPLMSRSVVPVKGNPDEDLDQYLKTLARDKVKGWRKQKKV